MHVQYIAKFHVPGFRGMHGFGAIPLDTNTTAAYALIQAIDGGLPGTGFLSGMDATTRATVCQRAIDILNLPACQAGDDPTAGTCLDPTGLQTPTATLKTKISTACASQGTSVSGAGLSTTAWVGIGAAGLLGAFLLFK